MGVIVPILLFVCLATLVFGSPRIPPLRERRRTRAVSSALVARHGFTARPSFTTSRIPFPGPPFHYGSAQRLTDQVAGEVEGLPVTSAGYSCHYNGSSHFYGIALVTLPFPVDTAEVRHEPAFHTVRVVEPVPAGRVRTGAARFDTAYEIYCRDPHNGQSALSAAGVDELLSAPEPFSWRAEGTQLLLWRSGGWSSAPSLLGCVRAASSALSSSNVSSTEIQAGRPIQ
ncbi:hypothetical protein E6W39_12050 [Kitasatospora acidiphila]|uniref:Uncharacterized protein n=1 Tax=Kitasatospora acidiphila TaxID=2567942 RepID=A0A540W1L2_9ACTN|nr:hypothetical protein [Kitasatospora acidiphila]TQF02857.1 hypothetical protein E6W39_12050 [Kitasatospora acidiphila]